MSAWGPTPDTSISKTKVFTINLAQAASTYTLATCNAVGGVVIEDIRLYVTTAGATFTAVSIQTNDTTAVEFLSVSDGAVANLTVGKNITPSFAGPTYLHTSKLVRYTISGSTGTGAMIAVIKYRPSVAGADIS